ncbi:MAG: hypothetical protein K2H45_03715 [Acetatifactor sp.]|nr:hypothetical protein [Acetatifactor sp.]
MISKKGFLVAAVLICMLYNIGCTIENNKENIDREIIRYLNMPVQDIIDLTNAGFDELSSIEVFEPNVLFPYIEAEPFLVICRNSDTTYMPIYISLYQDDEEKYLEMLHLNANMSFQDILEVMGTASVEESKEGAGGKRYMISFGAGELEYCFCSDNPDGKRFELYIGLAENS